MPRYFFNTSNGSTHIDDDGLDLPDLDAVRREAVRYGGSLLSADPDMVLKGSGLRIDVTDAARACCFSLRVTIEDGAA